MASEPTETELDTDERACSFCAMPLFGRCYLASGRVLCTECGVEQAKQEPVSLLLSLRSALPYCFACLVVGAVGWWCLFTPLFDDYPVVTILGAGLMGSAVGACVRRGSRNHPSPLFRLLAVATAYLTLCLGLLGHIVTWEDGVHLPLPIAISIDLLSALSFPIVVLAMGELSILLKIGPVLYMAFKASGRRLDSVVQGPFTVSRTPTHASGTLHGVV